MISQRGDPQGRHTFDAADPVSTSAISVEDELPVVIGARKQRAVAFHPDEPAFDGRGWSEVYHQELPLFVHFDVLANILELIATHQGSLRVPPEQPGDDPYSSGPAVNSPWTTGRVTVSRNCGMDKPHGFRPSGRATKTQQRPLLRNL